LEGAFRVTRISTWFAAQEPCNILIMLRWFMPGGGGGRGGRGGGGGAGFLVEQPADRCVELVTKIQLHGSRFGGFRARIDTLG